VVASVCGASSGPSAISVSFQASENVSAMRRKASSAVSLVDQDDSNCIELTVASNLFLPS
jgi:hypothetical protein